MAKKLINMPEDIKQKIENEAIKNKTSANQVILRILIEYYATKKE